MTAQTVPPISDAPTRLILRSFQCPGDGVVMTAAVRELHRQYPGQYLTDVRTSTPAVWEHNPDITRLADDDPAARRIDMHYPAINHSNQRPGHFLDGYCDYLAGQLGLPSLRPQEFRGHIYLSDEERGWINQVEETTGYGGDFWLVNAGSKNDYTCKQWPLENFQAVVDHFRGRIAFVQIGAAEHNHPALAGVIDLRGKTDHRQLIRLVYHARGVLTGVSYPMHLAAAVPVKGDPSAGNARGGRSVGNGLRAVPPALRPCVVINGGREPPHWEQYPGHQFLHTIGALDCCATGGCWKSRVVPLGDGDRKDRDLCSKPLAAHPRCMRLITPGDVIRRIELYGAGIGNRGQWTEQGSEVGGQRPGISEPASVGNGLRAVPPSAANAPHIVPPSVGNAQVAGAEACRCPGLNRPGHRLDSAPATRAFAELVGQNRSGTALGGVPPAVGTVSASASLPCSSVPLLPARRMLIDFRHGLGDAVQLTTVLAHLRHYHPDWQIDVAAGIGKQTCYRGLCRASFARGDAPPDRADYHQVFRPEWHECPTSYGDCPSTKAEYCLRSVFGLAPIAELCRYSIDTSPESRAAAGRYLQSICPMGPRADGRWPAVLIHYQGNTSTDQKNLSHDVARAVCDEAREAGFVPVVLDWDNRSPLIAAGVANPGAASSLWGGTGTGDAERLAALIAQSCLMVGIDSGPLHVAAATDTPAIGVWTRHHPVHYFGHAAHLLHLAPAGHAELVRGDRRVGLDYFTRHYAHQVYTDLKASLLQCLRERLPSAAGRLRFTRGFWIRPENAEQDLVVVEDVAEQDCYRLQAMTLPGPVLVDVGAHIGAFSLSFHRRHPSARIVSVECCPENIEALTRNVGGFASVVQAAVTYDRDVALLNAVYDHCASTGGSTLISRGELSARCAAAGFAAAAGDYLAAPHLRLGEYWPDTRPLRTVTLEELMAQHGLPRIDVLKLDCEGSEFSILENARAIDRIGLIAGEYHGRERFLDLVSRRFADWQLEILRDGDPGTFWLVNPRPPHGA